MDTSVLKELGLSRNEVSTYLAIMRLGVSKTGPIQKLTGIGSSQTYASLQTLIAQGLISYTVRNNVRHYRAEPPHTLVDNELRRISALKKLAEEMKRMKTTPPSRNFVNAFERKDGFRKAFLRHAELLKNGEEVRIIGYSARVPRLRELRSLLYHYNKMIESKHCTMRMILDENFRTSLGERVGPAYTIRFLHSDYFTPSAMSISKQEVVISVWSKYPLAISITEPSVVDGFANNFESLWKVAER